MSLISDKHQTSVLISYINLELKKDKFLDTLDEQRFMVAANDFVKTKKGTKVVYVRVIQTHNWRKNTFSKLAKVAKFQRINELSAV